MNTFIDIYLGQIIRAVLNMVVGYLALIGVSQAQQTSLAESLTPIVVAAVMFLVTQVWSAKSKKAALANTTNPYALRGE